MSDDQFIARIVAANERVDVASDDVSQLLQEIFGELQYEMSMETRAGLAEWRTDGLEGQAPDARQWLAGYQSETSTAHAASAQHMAAFTQKLGEQNDLFAACKERGVIRTDARALVAKVGTVEATRQIRADGYGATWALLPQQLKLFTKSGAAA